MGLLQRARWSERRRCWWSRCGPRGLQGLASGGEMTSQVTSREWQKNAAGGDVDDDRLNRPGSAWAGVRRESQICGTELQVKSSEVGRNVTGRGRRARVKPQRRWTRGKIVEGCSRVTRERKPGDETVERKL